jgi:lipopolysaccharide export system protein LptA
MNRLFFYALLALVPLALAPAPPQKPGPLKPAVVKSTPPPRQPEHPKGNDDPRVYYRYGALDYTSSDERLNLSKDVIFEYKDTVFKSQKVLYDRKQKIASSPTPVQLDDAQNTITGERGTAFYKLTTVKIEGNVKIIARPKPQNPQSPTKGLRKEFDSPVVILCNSVTYNWKTRIAIPEGNIRISFSIKRNKKSQKWNITSSFMEYDGKIETVRLKDNIKARADDSDSLDGETGTVVLQEGKERVNIQKATGSFGSDKIEEEDEKRTPPPGEKNEEKKTGGSGSDVVE